MLNPDLVEYSKESIKPQEQKHVSRSLEAAAKHNCAEFANNFSKCISYGSLSARSAGCKHQLDMLELCQEMQRFALNKLKFDEKSPNEQAAIKYKADDLMIACAPNLTITEEQKAKFYSTFE